MKYGMLSSQLLSLGSQGITAHGLSLSCLIVIKFGSKVMVVMFQYTVVTGAVIWEILEFKYFVCPESYEN